MQAVGMSFRIRNPICYAKINGLQPCRIGIAEPRDLNGRRLECKKQETITGGMARKVYKNIDRVTPDPLRGGHVIFLGNRNPMVCQFPKTLGHHVVTMVIRVAVYLDLSVI